MTNATFRTSVAAAVTILLVTAAACGLAEAQLSEPGAQVVRPSPVDPGLTPNPGTVQPMSGLEQEKLGAYRDRLESRMLDQRMSGRDLTPGGAREMRNVGGALGRVDGALGR